MKRTAWGEVELPDEITGYRIFIASPTGLSDERMTFRDVIQEYNESEALHRDVMFRAIGWEDALGGTRRPQTIINEDVRECDFLILVLWDRWGSPTGGNTNEGYSSGSEEEFRLAMKCLNADEFPMRDVLIMFKAVDERQMSDPGVQLQQVLDFKQNLEKSKKHLYEGFDTPSGFGSLIRKHLANWKRHHEDGWDENDQDDSPRPPDSPDDRSTDGLLSGVIANEPTTTEAWNLADEGRLTEAEVEFAKAVVGGDNPRSMMSYAGYLRRQGRLDQANVFLDNAIDLAKQKNDEHILTEAYANLGNILQIRGDLIGAENMHKNSLEIAVKLGEPEQVADALGNIGNVLNIRGELDDAERMYRRALELEEKLERKSGMATAYGNLGTLLATRGDVGSAEKMFQKSLEMWEAIDRPEGVAAALGNLGNILNAREDLDGAEAMYRKSLEINERLGRLEGMAIQYGNLGVIFGSRGDLDDAEEFGRKSLEINRKIGKLTGMASDYGNLGNVLRKRGDLDGAEQMHRNSLEIEERLGRLEGMASDYGNLGIIYFEREDYDVAEEMLKKALALASQLGSNPMIELAESQLKELAQARTAGRNSD